ncbi:unnamed protein product [Cuscuta campestris]|uniref:Uncharacterized protein n=1 Tax=Cuscuta campestris TaxID=132261 RepID=A0A484NMM8_9ASTE|nr:unnamed protein product [Cuscuta campestris]
MAIVVDSSQTNGLISPVRFSSSLRQYRPSPSTSSRGNAAERRHIAERCHVACLSSPSRAVGWVEPGSFSG